MRKNRFPFSHPKQSRLLPNTTWTGQPMPAGSCVPIQQLCTGTFWRTPKQAYFQWKLHQGVLCHQLSVQSSFCAWASLGSHQASPQHPTELFGTSHPGALGRSLNKLLSLQTSINLHYHLLQLLPNISPLPEGSQSGHNSLLSQGVNVL